ncbi:hypothetical protein PaeBR_20855 [Paenibacillus sp. BR2-3]|uniref:hypothetical protein n=1 Tax=Paenibacillus sp. BR2-3 TaxID=3048494 RepID=UPI003977A3A9
MPKSSTNPIVKPADIRPEQKDNNDNTTEEAQLLSTDKAADYVPSLNGMFKNKI